MTIGDDNRRVECSTTVLVQYNESTMDELNCNCTVQISSRIEVVSIAQCTVPFLYMISIIGPHRDTADIVTVQTDNGVSSILRTDHRCYALHLRTSAVQIHCIRLHSTLHLTAPGPPIAHDYCIVYTYSMDFVLYCVLFQQMIRYYHTRILYLYPSFQSQHGPTGRSSSGNSTKQPWPLVNFRITVLHLSVCRDSQQRGPADIHIRLPY
jgi:hypothetical protein